MLSFYQDSLVYCDLTPFNFPVDNFVFSYPIAGGSHKMLFKPSCTQTVPHLLASWPLWTPGRHITDQLRSFLFSPGYLGYCQPWRLSNNLSNMKPSKKLIAYWVLQNGLLFSAGVLWLLVLFFLALTRRSDATSEGPGFVFWRYPAFTLLFLAGGRRRGRRVRRERVCDVRTIWRVGMWCPECEVVRLVCMSGTAYCCLRYCLRIERGRWYSEVVRKHQV
jgi:hypothetical protein